MLKQCGAVLTFGDAAALFVGLGIGVGAAFELLKYSASRANHHRVYTLSNLWLILSGVVHVWIKFAFVFHRNSSFVRHALDLYASADSRYGNCEGAGMETGTAATEALLSLVAGPLCFLVAFASVNNLVWRHPAQIILSTLQLFGVGWLVLHPILSPTDFFDFFSSEPSVLAIAFISQLLVVFASLSLLISSVRYCSRAIRAHEKSA